MTEHLIHVGYPKAGSTFLQQWFAAHPQISYCHGGLAGFASVTGLVRAAVTQAQMPKLYATSHESLSTPVVSAGRAEVEFDETLRTMNRSQIAACWALRSLFPGARILIVTRGFRSMVLSAYSQYVRTGGKEGIGTNCMRAAAANVYNYDVIIAAYRAAFGPEKVIVLPYELLRDEPDAFLLTLTGKLGIDPFDFPTSRVNPSLSPIEMHWYPRLHKWIDTLPPGQFQSRVRRLYKRAAFRNRLRGCIRLLQYVSPGSPVTASSITDQMLEGFRGQASSLEAEAVYASYRDDYLI